MAKAGNDVEELSPVHVDPEEGLWPEDEEAYYDLSRIGMLLHVRTWQHRNRGMPTDQMKFTHFECDGPQSVGDLVEPYRRVPFAEGNPSPRMSLEEDEDGRLVEEFPAIVRWLEQQSLRPKIYGPLVKDAIDLVFTHLVLGNQQV